jgi:hypothetical protein
MSLPVSSRILVQDNFAFAYIVSKNQDNGFQNVSVHEAVGLGVALREISRNLILQ